MKKRKYLLFMPFLCLLLSSCNSASNPFGSYDYKNENGETVPGIGETETHSGSKCHVKGVVIGMIGDSFVLRDLFKAEKTGLYATIYCFTAFGSSMASILKVGLVVEFYCTATQFNGNIQLSNINVKFSGKQKFVVENDYENDEFMGGLIKEEILA